MLNKMYRNIETDENKKNEYLNCNLKLHFLITRDFPYSGKVRHAKAL